MYEAALDALMTSVRAMSVARVAALCGYENITYFNQVFKELAGMSPSRFRQMH
jgi:YesN/AraC family two-component response regulator